MVEKISPGREVSTYIGTDRQATKFIKVTRTQSILNAFNSSKSMVWSWSVIAFEIYCVRAAFGLSDQIRSLRDFYLCRDCRPWFCWLTKEFNKRKLTSQLLLYDLMISSLGMIALEFYTLVKFLLKACVLVLILPYVYVIKNCSVGRIVLYSCSTGQIPNSHLAASSLNYDTVLKIATSSNGDIKLCASCLYKILCYSTLDVTLPWIYGSLK